MDSSDLQLLCSYRTQLLVFPIHAQITAVHYISVLTPRK
jgi:hypothetical protein